MSGGSFFRFPADPMADASVMPRKEMEGGAKGFKRGIKGGLTVDVGMDIGETMGAANGKGVSPGFMPVSDSDYFTLKSAVPKGEEATVAESVGSGGGGGGGGAVPDMGSVSEMEVLRKPLVSAPTSGSISSVGSDATLMGSVSYTNHFSSLSSETLVEYTSPKARARAPMLGLGPLRPSEDSISSFSRPSRPSVASLQEEPELPGRNYTEPLSALPRAPISLPTLRKQHTLPCLLRPEPKDWGSGTRPAYGNGSSGNISPRVSAKKENYRDAIAKLSPTISFVSAEKVASLLQNSSTNSETGLRDVLVLDIRSFADYVKNHISGAINICLPSTLLKRATFNLSRCVISLPTYEQTVLQNYFHYNMQNVQAGRQVGAGKAMGLYGLPSIVVYDTSNTSANVYHICRKLVDFSCYDMEAAPPVYVVENGFEGMEALYADFCSNGTSDLIDLSTLSLQVEEAALESPKLSKTQKPVVVWPKASSMDISAYGKDPIRTPIISNFSLPKNLPQSQFKIRHNEEKFDFSVVSEDEVGAATAPLTSPEAQKLPLWLRDSAANRIQIKDSFQRLEECEKLRLNSAFKLKAQKHFQTPGGGTDITPIINSGLDFGHKNRYKDIFLYEHSRVTLSDRDGSRTEQEQQDCDYINASYVRPYMQNRAISHFLHANGGFSTQLNYLATQGPMQRTAGDFWRCIHNQRCVLVVSLTGETDNGVEKCYAFWNSGDYYSEKHRVHVRLVSSKTVQNVVVRQFEVEMGGVERHVTQMHLSTWQDMTSDVDLDEILSMVKMKRQILGSVQELPPFPTLIHCSAGCGRTGVFVAADMLINTLQKASHENIENQSSGQGSGRVTDQDPGQATDQTDPVYEVVNDLRRQRISMVQTLRQYSMIYSLLRESIRKEYMA